MRIGPKSAETKTTRLAWAQRYRRFKRADRANVGFVDKTKIHLQSHDGRKRVYHRREEHHRRRQTGFVEAEISWSGQESLCKPNSA